MIFLAYDPEPPGHPDLQQQCPAPPPPPPHNSTPSQVTPAGTVNKQHWPPLFCVVLLVLKIWSSVMTADPPPSPIPNNVLKPAILY